MNRNAEAIVILCSHLCVEKGVNPLEPREWSRLAQWLMERHMEPGELLSFSREDFREKLHCDAAQSDRMVRLLERSASLSFELSRCASMGIQPVTRADGQYPRRLKEKLGNGCPPLFYYAGNLELLDVPAAGYVGSRQVTAQDLEFTAAAVEKTYQRGYSVVSGGAKGIDSAAMEEVLLLGGSAVAYLADSLSRRIKRTAELRAIQEGRLLLLSHMKPDAGFQVGAAMARNRLIYCQSSGTVVVRSDLKKGGTWTGASECLKYRWTPVFCWNRPEYPGNAALIEQGAIPVGEDWDGDLRRVPPPQKPGPESEPAAEQMSLFKMK